MDGDDRSARFPRTAILAATPLPPFSGMLRHLARRMPASAAPRRFTADGALPAYGMAALALAIIASAGLTGAFTVDWPWLAQNGQSFGFFIAMAWAIRRLGLPRGADIVEATLLMVAVCLLLALCSAIFVSADGPLIDDALRRADLDLFGFRRETLASWLQHHATITRAAGWIYLSLGYMPALIIALLVLTRRQALAWALLTALLATCFLSIAGLTQAAAYGSPPYTYQFSDVLTGLRSGAIRQLDAGVVTGLVTFPSVHAADGLILACAASWLGRWAAPLVVLNLLMIASALAVGGHYLVDLLAGCVLGGGVLWLSLRLHARIARYDQGRVPGSEGLCPIGHAAAATPAG